MPRQLIVSMLFCILSGRAAVAHFVTVIYCCWVGWLVVAPQQTQQSARWPEDTNLSQSAQTLWRNDLFLQRMSALANGYLYWQPNTRKSSREHSVFVFALAESTSTTANEIYVCLSNSLASPAFMKTVDWIGEFEDNCLMRVSEWFIERHPKYPACADLTPNSLQMLETNVRIIIKWLHCTDDRSSILWLRRAELEMNLLSFWFN